MGLFVGRRVGMDVDGIIVGMAEEGINVGEVGKNVETIGQ